MPTSVSPALWIASIVLSVHCLSTATDVKLCDNDSIVELTAGQNTSVLCKGEGEIQWRLHVVYNGSNASFHLANCSEERCTSSAFLKETFSANITDSHTRTMTINSANNTKIQGNVRIVSGALECVYVNYTYTKRASLCGLNYVYPPENVSCEGVTTSWSVSVSCSIGSVYSSRGIYRCQLFSRKHWSKSLETVDMVTSPTSERITKSEVKMSGSCQFNTTLSLEEECSDMFVAISPGGRNYSVKLNDTTCFLINGGNKNTTVMEGDYVSFVCISHEQSPSQMYICNQDNDSVVWRESTLSNYTFIARCEDTAVYSCGNKATSVSLNLYVNCTPRNLLFKNLRAVNNESNQVVITFEVIAFPAPHQCNVWLIEAEYDMIEGSMTNFMCEAFTRRRYLYSCSVAVLNFPSHFRNGKYKIQVINEVGNENFTVAHDAKHQESNFVALSGGIIAAVVVVIVAAVFIVIRRRRRYVKDDTSSDFSSSDTVAVPLSVRGLGYGWWTTPPPTPTTNSAVDKGRWTNQDGLTYVSLNFNNRKQNRAPKYEPTEYSTVKAIQNQIQSY